MLAPRPAPIPEDQASIFISPRGRVDTHFSRLLRHAWVTVGLFLFPGHHTRKSLKLSRTFTYFMEPEGLLPCSQEPVPYPPTSIPIRGPFKKSVDWRQCVAVMLLCLSLYSRGALPPVHELFRRPSYYPTIDVQAFRMVLYLQVFFKRHLQSFADLWPTLMGFSIYI
jgi:hypothetical protein